MIKKRIIKPILLFPVRWPKLWSAIRGVVAAVPVSLLGFIRFKFEGQDPSTHKLLSDFFKSPASIGLLIVSPFLISIVCDIYEWSGVWLRDRQKNYVPALALTKTLAALNNVVGRKLNRFGEVAKRINGGSSSVAEVFEEITKPELQIEELTEQLWTLLTSLTGNPHLKVVLASVENGKLVGYAGFSPKSKRPKNELLDSKDSFFAYVARAGSFQVIDNIEEYIKKRERLKMRERSKRFPTCFERITGADNSGSICGFPIFHSYLNEVCYVLTIMSDVAGEITNDFKRSYLPVLEHFFDRILLEHSLKTIKKNAN